MCQSHLEPHAALASGSLSAPQISAEVGGSNFQPVPALNSQSLQQPPGQGLRALLSTPLPHLAQALAPGNIGLLCPLGFVPKAAATCGTIPPAEGTFPAEPPLDGLHGS